MDFGVLGDPSIKIGGLEIWVHGREFPDLYDYWDGNWLRVTAHCSAVGSNIRVNGPLIMVQDIAGWTMQCESLYRDLKGEALLKPHEPSLMVTIRAVDSSGHLEMEVEITPDHLTQDHRLRFDLDQSHLPALLRQCRQVISDYSVRGL